jgi:hypothetical protein
MYGKRAALYHFIPDGAERTGPTDMKQQMKGCYFEESTVTIVLRIAGFCPLSDRRERIFKALFRRR